MAHNHYDRRVVVTGMGVVTPLGNDLDTFWKNLISSQCGIDRISAFDASPYDTQIAGEVKNFDPTPAFPSPKEIRRTDRYSQFGVYAGWSALKDSGLDLSKENLDEFGVFLGSGIGGLSTTSDQLRILDQRGPGRVSPFTIPMLISNMASGLISMYFNLRGPNFATCSACATANHAIGEAWRTIKMGDAQVMLAGGSEAAVIPIGIAGFCSMRAMSTRNDDPKTPHARSTRTATVSSWAKAPASSCWRNWNTPKSAVPKFIARLPVTATLPTPITSPPPLPAVKARCAA